MKNIGKGDEHTSISLHSEAQGSIQAFGGGGISHNPATLIDSATSRPQTWHFLPQPSHLLFPHDSANPSLDFCSVCTKTLYYLLLSSHYPGHCRSSIAHLVASMPPLSLEDQKETEFCFSNGIAHVPIPKKAAQSEGMSENIVGVAIFS